MRIRGTLPVILVALAAMTLGGAHPASAEELSKADSTGDVLRYDTPGGFDSDDVTVTSVPRHRNGDLKRFRVNYGEKRIKVVFVFRELDRSDPALLIMASFQFPDDSQLDYSEAVIRTSRKNRAGRAELTTACEVRHRISYRNDRAQLSFPAECIDSPRWVRFNAGILSAQQLRKPPHFFADAVFPFIGDDNGAVERFTRRIRRGRAGE